MLPITSYWQLIHFCVFIKQILALVRFFYSSHPIHFPGNRNHQIQCCYGFVKTMKSLFFYRLLLFLVGLYWNSIRMFAWIDSWSLEIGFLIFKDPNLIWFSLNIKENNHIFLGFCSIGFNFSFIKLQSFYLFKTNQFAYQYFKYVSFIDFKYF